MKKSKFTEEQITYALKQAELGTPVAEVCRKMGISDATFYIYGLIPIANGSWRTRKSIAYIYPASGTSPSAQLEFRACRPQQLEGLKGRYQNQVPCSPGSTGVPFVNSSTHRFATLLSDTAGRLRASTR